MVPAPAFFYSSIAFLVSVGVFLYRRRSSAFPMPPGPKGYPLIGNLYDLPHHYAWLTYHEWAKKYGSIMSIRVFGANTIVVNSLKVAVELFEKRSYNYSDRPRMIMANELMDWDWDFAHMPYSDRWRRHRRSFHQYFQPRNLASFHPGQQKVTLKFLEQLLQAPEQFSAHVRQHVGSAVLRVAYGYENQEENDFYINLAHTAFQPLLMVVHAGTYLVEFIPPLKNLPKWFPGAGFKRQAEKWAVGARALRDVPFINLKKLIEDGTAEQSYVHDNLDRLKVNGVTDPEEEEIIKNCAAIMYLAGSDTTASVIQSWLLAMAQYPDVYQRARAEVDSVVGMTRLPDFSDRPSLPYIEATILETMRWAPVVPLGVPHRAIKEDIYQGYVIPAGATITPNVWTIMHDEEIYPEPHKFNPERFLQTPGKVDVQPDPVTSGIFGFGRRVCPGRHFALDSAWISIVSVVSTFNISQAVDSEGKIIHLSNEYTDGLVSHPKPFKVNITPRSEDTAKRIEAARQEAFVKL